MLLFPRLSALLFAALLATIFSPLVHAREMVSVARGEVNMRSGPGTRYDALWGLSRGYPLSVVNRRGAWIKVRDFEKDEGWVLRSLTNRVPHHVVRAGVANLRSTPSTRGRILGKARYGDVLRTLARRGDWIKVRHERGATGWVARRLVWGW
ncbi:Bacterial SH3 domain protein [compost metagenome]